MQQCNDRIVRYRFCLKKFQVFPPTLIFFIIFDNFQKNYNFNLFKPRFEIQGVGGGGWVFSLVYSVFLAVQNSSIGDLVTD